MALLLNADTLTAAKTWEVQLGNTDQPSFTCELYNGKLLQTAAVSVVFNRIQYINIGIWNAADKVEKNYVEQEFYAFYLAWLYTFKGRITNLPSSQCMYGVFKPVLVWRSLAAHLGMPVLNYDSTAQNGNPPLPVSSQNRRQSVYITGDMIIGHLPGMPAANLLLKLAKQQDCSFLEMVFEKEGKQWKFDTATSLPLQFHTSQRCMEMLYKYFSVKIKEQNGINMWHTQ